MCVQLWSLLLCQVIRAVSMCWVTCQCICQFICGWVFICMCVCIHVCQLHHMSGCLPSTGLSICLMACLSVTSFIAKSVCLPACLSVCVWQLACHSCLLLCIRELWLPSLLWDLLLCFFHCPFPFHASIQQTDIATYGEERVNHMVERGLNCSTTEWHRHSFL